MNNDTTPTPNASRVSLMKSVAADIEAAHQATLNHLSGAVESATKAGLLLLQVRKQVPHGEWESWIADNVSISLRTA